MKLKYEDLIIVFSECELSNCTPRNRMAFRWVFENIDDERNFSPRYFSSNYAETQKTDCLGYALSMFDKEDQAIARLAFLSKGKQNLYKKLGTHTAIGSLTIDEGLSNDSSINPDTFGHFSFFEFSDTDLSKKFTVSKQITPN